MRGERMEDSIKKEKADKLKDRIRAEEQRASDDRFHCGLRRGLELALKIIESDKWGWRI